MRAIDNREYPEFVLPGGVPLLDGITVKHGMRTELGHFFMMADAEARRRGVTLRLHDTMHGFVAVNEAMRAVWGSPVHPVFNPYLNDMDPTNSFWISGHDYRGRVVATQTARLLDLSGTNAADMISSMHMFYRDPARWAASGTRCTIQGAAARAAGAVTGSVVFGGGAWYHRDYRGTGLSEIMPRIGRNLAHTRWGNQYHISLVEDALVAKGVHLRYGYVNAAPGVKLERVFADVRIYNFVWTDPVHTSMDRAAYMSAISAERDVLTSEMEETNAAPRSAQGSSSLS